MIARQYEFFFGGFMSQWHPSPFHVDRVVYGCAEQFMMARKAALFDDRPALAAIMAATNPAEQKRIGRTVLGFDERTWHAVARDVVFRGNIAKFSQNPTLFKLLMETGSRYLVEASPTDRVWGIGLGEEDPRCADRGRWRGTNWLGEVLMAVRYALRD